MDIGFALQIGAFSITFLLFIKGVYEYTKAQQWKKAEFVASEIKAFYSDFDIKRALMMLDWNSNELDLKPNEMEGKQKLHFDDVLITSALHTHKVRPAFSAEEVLIKGVFDTFFDRLIMFDNYIETGLIATKDIKPYLIYWIKILADNQNHRKSNAVRTQIWLYIDEYGFNRVRDFCSRFGFKDIK